MNLGSPSEVAEFVWVNAESPSSILGCDCGNHCLSFVADATRWDGEQAVFLWSQVSSTVQPLILEALTSQIMPQELLNRALSEQGGAPPNN